MEGLLHVTVDLSPSTLTSWSASQHQLIIFFHDQLIINCLPSHLSEHGDEAYRSSILYASPPTKSLCDRRASFQLQDGQHRPAPANDKPRRRPALRRPAIQRLLSVSTWRGRTLFPVFGRLRLEMGCYRGGIEATKCGRVQGR